MTGPGFQQRPHDLDDLDRLPIADGVVPTEIYTRLLDQRGRDLDYIKALESMLRDAWLVCQAGRSDGDSLVVRVSSKRVEAWRHVLDASSEERP